MEEDEWLEDMYDQEGIHRFIVTDILADYIGGYRIVPGGRRIARIKKEDLGEMAESIRFMDSLNVIVSKQGIKFVKIN